MISFQGLWPKTLISFAGARAGNAYFSEEALAELYRGSGRKRLFSEGALAENSDLFAGALAENCDFFTGFLPLCPGVSSHFDYPVMRCAGEQFFFSRVLEYLN